MGSSSSDINLSTDNLQEAWVAFFKKYYLDAITELANEYPEKRSLSVDFFDVDKYNDKLSQGLLEEPDIFLEAATETLREMDIGNGVGLDKAHARIKNLPIVTNLTEIDPDTTASKLITIAGSTVLQVKKSEPKIKIAVFECPFCHHIFSIEQPPLTFSEPRECPEEEGGCGRKVQRFELLVDKCTTVKAQRISFQGTSEERKEIEVEDDLINQYSPGDEVLITGIIRFFQKKAKYEKTPYLDWYIEVNSMERVVKEYDEDTKNKAIELLKDPEILDKFAQFLEKQGLINGKLKKVITGEDKNKRLLFCSGLSAKYKRRIHCILIAQSSVGKSRLTFLLSLFFPRQIEELFRTTERAIDYLGTNLDGKILLLKEMAGGQSAQYSLRITMDPESDELRILTVVKDEKTNEPKTIEKRTLGTPVFVSTTTTAYFDTQTKNRAFLLPLDESEEQTKRIHDADDKERSEILPDLTSELNNYLCALDMLQPIEVKIPFTISYPTKNVKARRSRPHLLDLVEVITFLRQYQRNFIEIGERESDLHRYLIATPEDFELAKEIAEKSLSMDVEDLSPNAEKLFELFKEEGWREIPEDGEGESQKTLEEEADEKPEKIKVPFTIKSIREKVSKYLGRSYSKSAIRGFLDELDDANRIVGDEGNPKHYYILDEDGECTEMNSVHIRGSFGETELSKWLDTINNKHTFCRYGSGDELLSDIGTTKNVNVDHSNGARRDTQTGETCLNSAHCSKMRI